MDEARERDNKGRLTGYGLLKLLESLPEGQLGYPVLVGVTVSREDTEWFGSKGWEFEGWAEVKGVEAVHWYTGDFVTIDTHVAEE